jgi:hypothetical protein
VKVNGPRDLPDLRLHLLDCWRPGGPLREAAAIMNPLFRSSSGLPSDFSSVEATFDQRAIETAALWYVSDDMSALVAASAPSLPATTLTPELLPTKSGIAFFARPLMGTSADKDELFHLIDRDADDPLLNALVDVDLAREHRDDLDLVQVDALVWGDGEHLKMRTYRKPFVGISIYRALDFEGRIDWFPLGRTDWTYGDDTEAAVDPGLIGHDRRLASMAEDRRWMACLWLLASQARVGEQTAVPVERSARRRSQRAGYPADVRLIDVRRQAAAASDHDDGEAHHVEWSHRWLVNPHWRQQAYGPGRSLRRPVFILPHVKGPADKPLVIKPAVNVVRD